MKKKTVRRALRQARQAEKYFHDVVLPARREREALIAEVEVDMHKVPTFTASGQYGSGGGGAILFAQATFRVYDSDDDNDLFLQEEYDEYS